MQDSGQDTLDWGSGLVSGLTSGLDSGLVAGLDSGMTLDRTPDWSIVNQLQTGANRLKTANARQTLRASRCACFMTGAQPQWSEPGRVQQAA